MKESEIQLIASKGTHLKKLSSPRWPGCLVNPANKISELTIDQLADVFTGKIKNWKELAGAMQRLFFYREK